MHFRTPCKQGVLKGMWERRDYFLIIFFFKSEGLYISVIQDLEKKHEVINWYWGMVLQETNSLFRLTGLRHDCCLSLPVTMIVKIAGFTLSQDMQVHTLASKTSFLILIIFSKLTNKGGYLMPDATAPGMWTGCSWVQNRNFKVVATEIAGSPWKKNGLLNQDLRLVNVLETVCSLASRCRVSTHSGLLTFG